MSDTRNKRIQQYHDRWSAHALNPGIEKISEKLSPKDLRKHELFANYNDRFLERISPDVAVVTWRANTVLFEEGSYIDLAFFIVAGSLEISLQNMRVADQPQVRPTLAGMVDQARQTVHRTGNIAMLATSDFNLAGHSSQRLHPGEVFGEIGALSGWPQSVTARTTETCTLIQIRLPALRLMKHKSDDLKQRLDARYRRRGLFNQLKRTPMFARLSDGFLTALTEKLALVSTNPDEQLTTQGEEADVLYLVRSGFVKLMQGYGEGSMVGTYLSKGQTLGEIELLLGLPWANTAISVEYAELIKIPRSVFTEILKLDPHLEETLWRQAGKRIKETGYSRRNPAQAHFNREAVDLGLIQGNSILVIDLETCTRCDDCVRACAATHEGRPRFVREGPRLGNALIARSCLHCQDPVCLVGCPTGAIGRVGGDEVIAVDGDLCIGCATCANNCPYDAIVMHDMGEPWAEDMVPAHLRGTPRLQASKCDLCYGKGHGPACVSNCPQGSLQRLDDPHALQAWFGGGEHV